MIDLDQGKTSGLSKEITCKENQSVIMKKILNSLLQIRNHQIGRIWDPVIQKLYDQAIYNDYHKIYELFELLKKVLDKPNLTISDLRKSRLITKEYNTYYKPF